MQKQQETGVQLLGRKDALEKEIAMATHSRILGLENPMDRGVWQAYSPWGCKDA